MTHILNFKPQTIQSLNRFQEFIFVSDSAIDWDAESVEQLHQDLNNNWLVDTKIGSWIDIAQIYAPQTILRQLSRLKFQPEQKAQLVSKSATGSVVVKIDRKLIGIGAKIAQRTIVTFVDEEK